MYRYCFRALIALDTKDKHAWLFLLDFRLRAEDNELHLEYLNDVSMPGQQIRMEW